MANKEKVNKVTPRVLKGFRDYPPEEEIARQILLEKTREIYELHGFLPLQTASLEFAETLLGPHYTDDNLKELFGFTGPEEVNMALRYEFTVSLARYVAGNPQLPLPFRRYQFGNVWRVDKPGPGRFREFMQCDFDIVGTASMLADAEIIAVMVEVLDHLGIKNFMVRFSNRKLINGLTHFAGIPEAKATDVFRVVDKLEKQGKDAVILELGPGRTDKSGDKIPGLNLTDKQISQISDFLDLALGNTNDILAEVENLLGDIEISREGIDELREIKTYLSDMNVPSDKAKVDITIVRGLGYYTGPVYETTLIDLPDYGSVFSGGRYDNLVNRFSGQKVPATGSSFGVDRMLAALTALNAIKTRKSTSDVIVTTMDKTRIKDYLAIVREIREAGIKAELYSGETRNINKQLKYADKIEIPIAVIGGSDEFNSGTITVKDLRAGREVSNQVSDREEWLKADQIQATIKRSELLPYLKKLLAGE
ncbi:MAG: histidine--tRNA ligase [candidate division Zixibacteria bacterium HGW-Zixibacteria-1]|nr:MAG: histidine--tRNA ligase [candidate division Zixibacteria bacterium HGW-Zixibacteria-1]